MANHLGRNLRVVTADQDDLEEDDTVGSPHLGEFGLPLSSGFADALAQNKKHELCSILVSPDVDIVMTMIEVNMTTGLTSDLQTFRVTGGAGLHLRDYDRFLITTQPGYFLGCLVSPSTANFTITAQIDVVEISILEH